MPPIIHPVKVRVRALQYRTASFLRPRTRAKNAVTSATNFTSKLKSYLPFQGTAPEEAGVQSTGSPRLRFKGTRGW